MLNSYLVRFVKASVQLIQGHLSVTCLVCLITGAVADVPPSLTVNVSVFITGHTVFSVQTGHSRVIHLIHHSCRCSCITNLVTKTSKCLNDHWAHLCEPKQLNLNPVVIMSLERFDGLLKIMAVKKKGLWTGIPCHNSFIDINSQKYVSEFERIIFVLCQT